MGAEHVSRQVERRSDIIKIARFNPKVNVPSSKHLPPEPRRDMGVASCIHTVPDSAK